MFVNASEVWGNGCKTIFSLLLNPSGETLESQYLHYIILNEYTETNVFLT